MSYNIIMLLFQVDVEKDALSDLLSWLAIHIKPRYYFVPSSQKYYERQPYRLVLTTIRATLQLCQKRIDTFL